jgi:hypothetical protein
MQHERPSPALHAQPTRAEILRLAAEANLDTRSARKALLYGADSLRGDAGVRAARALAILPRVRG